MGLCWGYIKFHRDNGKENGSYYLGSTVSGYLSEGPDNDAPGPCSRAHTCVHMKDLQALPVNSTLQRRGNRSKKRRIFPAGKEPVTVLDHVCELHGCSGHRMLLEHERYSIVWVWMLS